MVQKSWEEVDIQRDRNAAFCHCVWKGSPHLCFPAWRLVAHWAQLSGLSVCLTPSLVAFPSLPIHSQQPPRSHWMTTHTQVRLSEFLENQLLFVLNHLSCNSKDYTAAFLSQEVARRPEKCKHWKEVWNLSTSSSPRRKANFFHVARLWKICYQKNIYIYVHVCMHICRYILYIKI